MKSLAMATLLLSVLCILERAGGQEGQTTFESGLLLQDGKKDKDSGKKDKDSKKKDGLKHIYIDVGGLKREALVAFPDKKKKPAPVIFVFHGHGNSMKGAAEGFGCHEHWDDAICVYPQGLKTPSPNDPLGEKSGWELVGPRDYLFFDTLLVELSQEHAIDPRRIFSAGFSNGAAFFTFGLWVKRGPVLRAVASVGGFYEGAGLSPKPCLLIAGKKDKQFEKQQDTIKMVRNVNGCEGKGMDWPQHKSKLDGTLYPSSRGAPTVKLIHAGDHSVPNAAGALIVEFFKDVSKN